MAYDYATERPKLFTEDGVKLLREIEGQARGFLATAGAFQFDKISVAGDGWVLLACIDYLVEQKVLVEVTKPGSVWGQHRVFCAPVVR
jgi:hypothetical protein